MRLCGTIPDLTGHRMGWPGAQTFCPKDSRNTSGGCRACAKLSIPPSTRLHRQLKPGVADPGAGRRGDGELLRAAGLGESQVSVTGVPGDCQKAEDQPFCLVCFRVQKDPLGSTRRILTSPRFLSPAQLPNCSPTLRQAGSR